MSSASDYKAMQLQQRKLQRSSLEVEQQLRSLEREKSQLDRQMASLEAKLAKQKARETLIVSEHAILRYLERVKGVNLEELQEEILDEEILTHAHNLQYVDADIPCNARRYKVRIRDRVVITVLTKGFEQ